MRKGEEDQNVQPSYYARSRAKREQQNEAEFRLGHLLATIEYQIDKHGEETGYANSVAYTTFRISQILSDKALRQEPGLAQLLQQMRSNGTAALSGARDQSEQSQFAAEAPLHVRSRAGRPLGSKNGSVAGLLRARDLGRPLTREEKRANWRLQAQQHRDAQLAAGLNSSGKPYKHASGLDKWGNKRKISPKQLAAMRANAIKARAAHRAKHKVKQPMSAARRAEMSKIMQAAYARKKARKEQEGGAAQ